MAAYADAQAQHRVLTEDVKFLSRRTARASSTASARSSPRSRDAIAAARPDLAAAKLQKPLTMLLFGMMNWMFTWLRPTGALTPCRHDAGRHRPVLRRPRRGPGAVAAPHHRAARASTALDADRLTFLNRLWRHLHDPRPSRPPWPWPLRAAPPAARTPTSTSASPSRPPGRRPRSAFRRRTPSR